MEWHAVEWRNSERITQTVMFLSAHRLPSPDDVAKNVETQCSPERITSVVMISEMSARFCIARLISSELSSCILSRTRELGNSRNSLSLDLIRRPRGAMYPDDTRRDTLPAPRFDTLLLYKGRRQLVSQSLRNDFKRIIRFALHSITPARKLWIAQRLPGLSLHPRND